MIHDPSFDDAAAWQANPLHRWVYDKLIVADRVGVRAGPQGVKPIGWPCIWRPVYNIDGMGRNAVVSDCCDSDPDEPGLFWSEMLCGDHISTDAIAERGALKWTAQAVGRPNGPQRFSQWTLGGRDEWALESVAAFASRHLPTYAGPLNVETIGGRIIEVHLRLTADWIRAGAYDAYPAPCRPLKARPHFQGPMPTLAHDEVYFRDEQGPRLGIAIKVA